ncbi:ABC transporter permease [Porticoccaceae bacterium LTM1]|nr:ABC transporter permease [Porticoccaceae bacterium LTM1]
MYSNYSLLIWRNLLRQPVASAINILTLAIGLTAATVAIIILYYHLGFEQQYPNADNIYQIRQKAILANGEIYDNSMINYRYHQQIQQNYPELNSTLYNYSIFREPSEPNSKIQLNDFDVTEESFLKADQSFWRFFEIPFIAGDADTALSQPYTLVITASSAKRLFGDREALGQVIQLHKWPMKIVGVIPDFPEQTVLNPNLLSSEIHFSGLIISASSKEIPFGFYKKSTENWSDSEHVHSYIALPPEGNTKALEQEFTSLILGNLPKGSTPFAKTELKLAPLKGLHLRESIQSKTGLNINSWKFLIIMLSMAAAILLVACLNSTVISTVLYQRRAIEVGIRKISGATPTSIARQFFSESICITVLAATVAAVLIAFSLPWINQATNSDLGKVTFLTPTFVSALMALIIFVSLATSWYPAYRLGTTPPLLAIEKQAHSKKNSRIITALTILQFIFSIALFSTLTVMSFQLKHISQLDIGANFENIIHFQHDQFNIFSEKTAITRKQLLQHPDILSARSIDHFYGHPLLQSKIEFFNNNLPPETKNLTMWPTNPDGFLEHHQINLLSGEKFSRASPITSQDEYVKFMQENKENLEALLTLQGLQKIGVADPKQAIGAKITSPNAQSFRIVGVINAFPKVTTENDHLGADIIPAFRYPHSYNSIRFKEGTKESVKQYIKSIIEDQSESTDEVVFMDSKPFGLQQLEKNISQPISHLASLGIGALVISVLGLYAISLLNAQRRFHEIGIRKVLGASKKRLSGLMVFDSCKPLLVSLIIGLPVGYLISKQFLQAFIEQPPIALIVFALVPAVVVLIAVLVTLSHSLSAAKCDPAKVLRSQ